MQSHVPIYLFIVIYWIDVFNDARHIGIEFGLVVTLSWTLSLYYYIIRFRAFLLSRFRAVIWR